MSEQSKNITRLVAAAIPEARQLLAAHGFDHLSISPDGNRWDVAARLAGHAGPDVSEADAARHTEYADANYALGIAVGLLRRPEAFGIGGRS